MPTHLPSEIIKFTQLIDSSKDRYLEKNLYALKQMENVLEDIKNVIVDYCFLKDMPLYIQNQYHSLTIQFYEHYNKL